LRSEAGEIGIVVSWSATRKTVGTQYWARKAPSDPLIGDPKVISNTLTFRVTTNPEESYINQMIRLVESSDRRQEEVGELLDY
jgi:cation transport ATPase